MKLLGIDTSSESMSIAVTDEETVKIELNYCNRLTHSEKLMPAIANCLDMLSMDLDEIDAIALTIGPGSFTGLRIGASVANAFAWSKRIPVYGIGSLGALAQSERCGERLVICTMDAQSDNYYTSLFQAANGTLVGDDSITILHKDEILDKLRAHPDSVLYGELCAKLTDEERETVTLADKTENFIRASHLCKLARERIAEGDPGKKAAFPLYIRKSQAEVNFEKKQKEMRENASDRNVASDSFSGSDS